MNKAIAVVLASLGFVLGYVWYLVAQGFSQGVSSATEAHRSLRDES
jgi:hypothetical protein